MTWTNPPTTEERLKRHVAAAKVPTPGEQDRLEVRLLAIYITVSFAADLIEPIIYIFGISPSMLFRVSSMAHSGNLIGLLFVVALLLTLPHAFSLIFLPRHLGCRWPRKLACAAAGLSAVIWFYLAVLAAPLDVGPLAVLYGGHVIQSVFLALLFAMSLNAQQLRNLYDSLVAR